MTTTQGDDTPRHSVPPLSRGEWKDVIARRYDETIPFMERDCFTIVRNGHEINHRRVRKDKLFGIFLNDKQSERLNHRDAEDAEGAIFNPIYLFFVFSESLRLNYCFSMHLYGLFRMAFHDNDVESVVVFSND